MKFLSALVLVTMLAAGDGFDSHGNNPGNNSVWLPYQIGEIEFLVPQEVAVIFSMLAPDVMNPSGDCAELALMICGEGRICCFRVAGSNGDIECSFSCQDAHGNCQPCGGDPEDDMN